MVWTRHFMGVWGVRGLRELHSNGAIRLHQWVAKFTFDTHIIMMLGSKGILTPLIPNCYVLCTLAILKTFVIRSFFFKKWLLTHVFGGSQVQKSSCKQAWSDLWPFDPGIIWCYGKTVAHGLVRSWTSRLRYLPGCIHQGPEENARR